MTALTAKRDVEIDAERRLRLSRGLERNLGIRGDGFWSPDRKRRVIRDKVAADLGLLEVGHRRRFGHALLYRLIDGPLTGPSGPTQVQEVQGNLSEHLPHKPHHVICDRAVVVDVEEAGQRPDVPGHLRAARLAGLELLRRCLFGQRAHRERGDDR